MTADASAPQPSATHQFSADVVIKLTYRDGNGVFHANWPISSVDQAASDKAGLLWVDILGPDEHATTELQDWLCRHFHFHHLAVEDALAERTSPRSTTGENISTSSSTSPASSRTPTSSTSTSSISSSGPTTWSRTTQRPCAILDQDRVSIERDPRDRMRNGADHLLYRFLELAIDQSLGRDRASRREGRPGPERGARERQPRSRCGRSSASSGRPSCCTRRSLPSARCSTAWPAIRIKPVQPKHRVYFRDLYDHVVRIHDISESLRDLIAGAVETYLSVVSNRTNDIMKALTIVTVMFLPMSFLVGFFGMNFFGETLAFTNPLPRALLFWGSVAIMAISPCFIWIYARRRNWF